MDCPAESLIVFCADGDPLGHFAIIQQSEGGWGLILTQPLDREVKDRHALRVMATDGKFQASVSVDVHVLDINDNSPQCEQVREPSCHVTSVVVGLKAVLTSVSVSLM